MLVEHMLSSPEDENDATPASDEGVDELEDETDEVEDLENHLRCPKSLSVPRSQTKVQSRKSDHHEGERSSTTGELISACSTAQTALLRLLVYQTPQHTPPVILRCAILGSPRKHLTTREIYATVEAKYP